LEACGSTPAAAGREAESGSHREDPGGHQRAKGMIGPGQAMD